MVIKIFKSKILEARLLALKVKYLKFSLPQGFSFSAGQYLSLTIFDKEKKFRNPYTIATRPGKKFGEYCIKLKKKGKASNYVEKLKKGDRIELFGPAGKFVVKDKLKNKGVIFLSTGTGISPFCSMIPDLLNSGFKKKIILLKGFRNEKCILYDKFFLKLQKKYKNFEFHNILSRSKNKNFKDKGYVQDFFEKYISKNFQGIFYICGLDKMIEDSNKALRKMGFKKERIFFEGY